MFLLVNIHWIDIVDVLLVGFIIYQLYQLTKGTSAIKIFLGLFVIYLVWKIVDALQMNLLGEILGQLMGVGVIAVIIVFQQELRQFLLFIGNRDVFRNRKTSGFLQRFLPKRNHEALIIKPIIQAVELMAASKTGALILIQQNSPLEGIVQSGRELDAKISTALIQSVFFKNSPMHDGAMIIRKNRIHLAGAVLPVSQREDLPLELGMRHRAALGVSEQTDAAVIVVSEETGKISFTKAGEIMRNVSSDQLQSLLEKLD
ncbi:MAG: diadenylate cyclase CdaA [Bacteroidota bacterium]